MGKPLLSIGMIVKDEIRCIEKCLQALQPLRDAVPCELVIADTGSADGTREVAERYADIFFDFPWNDDFSAARNAVMDRCAGKWYLSVDADEYLVPDLRELREFLWAKHPKNLLLAFVIQRNYSSKDMEGRYGDFPAPRMLRLDSGLRYHGSIHESWMLPADADTKILSKTVFDHDGYAPQSLKQAQKKAERNMKLLRAELEKNPDDMRRLNQCVESSVQFPQERMSYILRAMELFMAQPQLVQSPFGLALCRTCLQAALLDRLPQAARWLSWGEEHIGQSVYFRVDVAFSAAVYFLKDKEYETALSWAERYLKAQEECAQRRVAVLRETMASSLNCLAEDDRQRMLCIKGECLARLGREEEALAVLLPVEAEKLEQASLAFYLQAMDCLRECRRAQVRIGELLGPVLTAPPEEEEEREKRRKNAWNKWLMLVGERFQKPGDGEDGGEEQLPNRWHLFREVPCELGWAARLIDADEEEGRALLERIQDWRQVPVLAIRHAVELRLPLPESFFRRSAQEIRDAAAALVDPERPERIGALLDWMDGCDFTASMPRFQFQFELTMAALRAENWRRPGRAKRLCGLFISLAADYMPNYYSAALLESEEDWNALPGMHQFALLLLKGQRAWNSGDELGWVRALRQGLKAAPAMKGMVEFMGRHRPARPVDPQLRELADRVRAVLSQYAPGDPAVRALKESPAYQKVAPLLESGADAVPWEPASAGVEQEFAALEQACSFSSLEEAQKAVKDSFFRLSARYQKGLTAYWAKFPLWGSSRDQVLDGIARAFFDHWRDFAWMYRRLMDNRSRRTLLAVLRNWRNFEVEPLNSVIDNRFDDYFDLEVLSCDETDVVADLGAYTGDTFLSYVKNYGAEGYKRYYCYEITPENYQKLLRATASYSNVVCRRKGAGAGPGEMFLSLNSDSSANGLEQQGSERVEVAALDDDIEEPLTLIKMDIEGAEQSALAGCMRHIRQERPKLALSVYHNFEDLWKLARMVDQAAPGYRFYLRYHGGNLWPSEITLLGVPG
ncbi:FkbM family methyltransferase [uncultured Pseudoflavonifractor sp.]|uniref:FkbM family methyltransferase n=1 Tax=uncultured Pseudoflavonifractor sp. TaxID=1221379 RepID=UPI0025F10709|nr:FkbM family methyltransferase [uncultured Pseudoflavonifractor sp.]